MALQSQTYANSGNAYYIRGADPIVPGDQGIIGPVEILPGDTSAQPLYYNRFNQTNATGLAISEFRTAGNELLSDIILNTQNSILLTSRRTGEEAVLEVGVNQAGDKGQVKLNADDGLIVNNLSGSGKGLQIYHDGPTNQNILETVDGTGAKINFQGNTGLILVTNDVTADKIAITQNTDLVTIEKPGVGILSLTSGGVQFAGTTSSGRVGNFNGANVLVDSSTSVSIRTNTSGSTNTAITANANGTVNFLSTITAPTVNAMTANISTINSSTFNNTGNARIASVAVTNDNTASSVPYSTYYGNYQGNLRYNTIRDTAGAPATAIESLEIINVAGGPQTGGIQFYTADNGTPANVKWMGGFLQNNVGGGQSEFRLASTITASMPQLVNVSTINSVSVLDLGVPVGTIIQYAVWNPPAGYLRCDGASYATATYPRLFSVLGYNYGGSGASFNVPDCLGKTLMGALSQATGGFNPPVLSAYQATVSVLTIVTGITGSDPLFPITNGLWVNLPNKPLTVGLEVLTTNNISYTGPPGLRPTISQIIGGNGATGNPDNGGFLLLFGLDYAWTITGPNPSIVFRPFSVGSSSGSQYPTMFANLDNIVGIPNDGEGSLGAFQTEKQVGQHSHTQFQPGAQAAPGLTWRAGDPNQDGPQVKAPSNQWGYTVPAYGTEPARTFNGNETMQTIPYNLGVTMCIRAI